MRQNQQRAGFGVGRRLKASHQPELLRTALFLQRSCGIMSQVLQSSVCLFGIVAETPTFCVSIGPVGTPATGLFPVFYMYINTSQNRTAQGTELSANNLRFTPSREFCMRALRVWSLKLKAEKSNIDCSSLNLLRRIYFSTAAC